MPKAKRPTPGESLRVDPDELTIGDLEDFEEAAGVAFEDAFVAGPDGNVKPSLKAIKAIVWVVKRQSDPGFTLDDARNVKLVELEIGSEAEGSAPTSAVSAT